MNHKKDNYNPYQNETIFIEVVMWLVLFGFLYLYSMGIF